MMIAGASDTVSPEMRADHFATYVNPCAALLLKSVLSVSNTLLPLFILLFSLEASVAVAQEQVIYYHNDALGSPVVATDADGSVLWEEDYSPYGSRLNYQSREQDCSSGTCLPSESIWDEKQWFTGHIEETRVGLLYMGARWYEAETGRFLSVDPVQFTEENIFSFNRYAYANNNPYKYTDPDGESPVHVVKFFVDLSLNIAINYATTGEANLGGALIDSAINIVNPLSVANKAKKLSQLSAKSDNVTKGASQKPIIVGENMKRVKEYADKSGGHAYQPWKNEPFNFELGMKRNERWIKDQMRNGREVIDIGPDFQRRAATGRSSPFYEMERRNLKGYDKYNKAFERSGSNGGVSGLDF